MFKATKKIQFLPFIN